jgi:hypothetical protein
MIKIRLSSLGKINEKDLSIREGETAIAAVERALDLLKISPKGKESFHFLVNGLPVDRELAKSVILNSSDIVLIAPRISEGDSGALIKTAAIIAVTVYTGGTLAPALGLAAGGVGAALLTAGVTIGASMLLNSLIPPPVPEALDLSGISGGGSASGFSSQMYSINGQSNQTRKFNFVPKVYGKHKYFPALAATPYTELEADQSSGSLVQYFYAIYDFGFGPCYIENLKIGDSPITNFADVTYRLVDLNRPVVSEGIWDDQTVNSFTYYKGQISADSVSVALNDNQNDSPAPALEDYQAIRNSSSNPDSLNQEITLSFVCPRGLYAFDALGTRDYREIILEVYFSRLGANDWKPYNSLDDVFNFSAIGGNNAIGAVTTSLGIPGIAEYSVVGTRTEIGPILIDFITPSNSSSTQIIYTSQIIPAGATYIVAKDGDAEVGELLSYSGTIVGIVTSISSHSAGYSKYHLGAPLQTSLDIYKTRQEIVYTNGGGTITPGPVTVELPSGGYAVPLGASLVLMQQNKIFSQRNNLGRFSIKRDDTAPVYSTIKFSPKVPDQYEIRVTRVESISPYTSTIADELAWAGVSTRFDTDPIVTDKRHTFLELKIRATNQLSGAIQTLSGEVTSVLDVYNGTTWVKQLSNSPVWIFVDLLTGQINKRAIDKSRLHLDSLLEWEDFCEAIPNSPSGYPDYLLPRFTSNFIFDFPSNLQGILNKVANSSQASLNLIDGKYGVLVDKLRTTPVQIFTPRNSTGFTSVRNYTRKPDAVKISYIDPEADWENSEITVYDTGFTVDTAVEIDDLASFGVTNAEQAWRFGRYVLAQNRLRQENITIQVDFEHLVCTRGDYVQITQDVMKVGGSPARVKSVSGNQVVIDDGLETGMFSYGFVFRGSDGVIVTDTLSVVSSDTFDLDGSIFPEVGDLIVIGVVDEIVLDCIVKSISPNPDLSATITLVEKADAIYTAESDDIIPGYEARISTTTDTVFGPPGEVEQLVVADNAYRCIEGARGIEYYIDLDWNVPQGAAFDVFEIYLDYGRGYSQIATIQESLYRYIVPTQNLGLSHSFKVLAVSASGKKLDLGVVGSVSATPLIKTTPPSDVETLNIDITGETLQLFWPAIADCDLNEYLIRYSPVITDTWESSVPLLRIGGNSTLATTQARTGVYLIKAIDLTGNESDTAAVAITTIPELFGLNVVSEVTDFPGLNGTLDRVVDAGGSLLLQETISGGPGVTQYEPEGYYYYENFLDLGDIYSVRLQSKIRAEGYTLQDLMSNWVTLSSVLSLSTSGFSDWDVEAQYRTTESFNVMADWTTLDSINPISEGQQDLWTAWKKFIIGDATGRIFQFRLKLISNTPSVTPRVFDGTIRADMPDRVEFYNNISAPGSGFDLEYSPSFKGPSTSPNIQISIDGASTGDYWTFDYRTLDGFYIRFFDKDDNPVARTFDAQVVGFGRLATEII